jgi:hypothetical protein
MGTPNSSIPPIRPNNQWVAVNVFNPDVFPISVVYPNNTAHWSESIPYKAGNRHLLNANFYLSPGDTMISKNKLYKAVLGTNGNLEISDFQNTILFSTKTTNGDRLLVKSNGSLILFDKNNKPVWVPDTFSRPHITGTPYLILDDDGTLKVMRYLLLQDNTGERSYDIKVWQSANTQQTNIDHIKRKLNKKCDKCEKNAGLPYSEKKNCNCDTPLASVSRFAQSLMADKTQSSQRYMSNPLQMTNQTPMTTRAELLSEMPTRMSTQMPSTLVSTTTMPSTMPSTTTMPTRAELLSEMPTRMSTQMPSTLASTTTMPTQMPTRMPSQMK